MSTEQVGGRGVGFEQIPVGAYFTLWGERWRKDGRTHATGITGRFESRRCWSLDITPGIVCTEINAPADPHQGGDRE